jgi:hypothetical protein
MGSVTGEVIDTGEKRDGHGRKLSRVNRPAEFVRAYQGSGLAMAVFARREGLKYSTLAGWVWKNERRGRGPAAALLAWIGLSKYVAQRPLYRLEQMSPAVGCLSFARRWPTGSP